MKKIPRIKKDGRDKEWFRNYINVHCWLRYNYGPAMECENPDCKGRGIKFYWGKLRDKEYEKKVSNFVQLCNNCHVLYDNYGWNMNLEPTKKMLSPLTFRPTKIVSEYLEALCIEFGENRSRMIMRLVIEEYTRRYKRE